MLNRTHHSQNRLTKLWTPRWQYHAAHDQMRKRDNAAPWRSNPVRHATATPNAAYPE